MNKRRMIFPDLLFLALLILLTFVSFLSYQRLDDLNESSDLVEHTQNVNIKLKDVLLNLINAETGQRGYLITHDSIFLEPFTGSIAAVKKNIAQLDSLTADNSRQHANLAVLSSLVLNRLEILNKSIYINAQQPSSTELLKTSLKNGKYVMDQIRSTIASMSEEESNLLKQRIKDKNHMAFITPLYSLLLAIMAILIVTAAYFRLRKEIHLRFQAEANEMKVQQQQQVISESEKLFRNIADTVPVLIWLSDTEKLIYFFNKGWLEFTGRSIAIEKGNGWLGGLHADDVKNCMDIYDAAFKERKEFYMEYRLKRADGQYRWVSNKGVPRYSTEGAFLGYAGASMDIQEQKNFSKELEKKVAERTFELKQLNEYLQIQNNVFSHAEENAMMGSYSWNLQTAELEYSDNLFRLFGCKPQEFTPSFEKFLSFIHPDDKERVIQDGKETYETRILVEHVFRVITKQGNIRYMRSSGNFIGEENNKYLVGSILDITKDMLLNESLNKKNIELEQNYGELESFNYVASHDLKEPLRKIQSFSKMILNKETGNLSETGKDYFSRIIFAAERMQNLIDALLSYSSASKSEIKFAPTDLNQVMEEVENNLRDLIEEKKVTIEKDVLPNINVISFQVYQLFSNIISNAIKYGKLNVPVRIKITSSIVSGEQFSPVISVQRKKFWKITISDNGIGFDQQYEHKIFEPFQRLHGRNEYEGTGIGLAICKKIVQNHNGYLTATGQAGVGAAFNIYLPVLN